jgi:regulator of protease activity HflC (stomatin/prohibitin superfamily)
MRTTTIVKLILTLALTGATGCATVPAGHRGIKVYYLGKSQGVDTEELGVGRYAYWPFTQGVYKFPVFQQNVVWRRSNGAGINFQTSEGITVGADVGMSYSVDPKKVSVLFQKYRRGIEEITGIFLRHIVADTCNMVAAEMTIESVYGKGRVDLLKRVNELVAKAVGPTGILVERIYVVGEFRMPPQVVAAINAKIEATQRAQQRENELRETQAEAAKRIASATGDAESARIRGEGEARAIRELQEALTPQYLKYAAIERWDGRLPNYVGTGEALPFLSIEDEGAPLPTEGGAPTSPASEKSWKAPRR